MSEVKKENIHKGHRDRMKKQFLSAGFENMQNHVVLEMLLYFGIPQKDTNTIAHELINKFGSFSRVFDADFEDLKSIKGMTENAAYLIKMMLPIYKRYASDLVEEEQKESHFLSSEKIVKYMKTMYAGTYDEKVYLLCFDKNHRLIATEQVGSGDVSQAFISMRDIAKIVLSNKTRDVILVHNHPYSIALPSLEDVRTTENVCNFLKILKVRLADHIIISQEGFCSMVSYPKYVHLFLGTEPIDFIDE